MTTCPCTRRLATLAVAAALAGLTGCGQSSNAQKATPGSTATAASPTPAPTDSRSEADKAWEDTMLHNETNLEDMHRQAAAAASNDPSSTETADLPDLVGMNLDGATDLADALGFMWVIDEDATGQGRAQVGGNKWMVCSQDPAPGVTRLEALVVLHAVRHEEACP
jgi:ABC-type glycerol-3-phosphate transport system substrate-binding protein